MKNTSFRKKIKKLESVVLDLGFTLSISKDIVTIFDEGIAVMDFEISEADTFIPFCRPIGDLDESAYELGLSLLGMELTM